MDSKLCITALAALLLSVPAAADEITVYTSYEEDEAARFLELAKQDMPDYMDVVGRSLRRDGGQKCFEAVQNGTRAVASLVAM